MTQRRVSGDTRRAFFWLLGLSLILHLIFTPLAGLVGLFELWFDRPTAADEGPVEQLKELPIELFEQDQPAVTTPGQLPEEDPVSEIDRLVELPVAEPAKPSPTARVAKPEPKPKTERDPKTETETPNADAGAVPAPSNSAPNAAPVPPPVASAATPALDTREPSTATRPIASHAVEDKPPVTRGSDTPIENPVTLAGKAGKIIEKQTSVGLVLYLDRVRAHPMGKRIGALLPKLPQWDEFFGKSAVNPVADFDRMFLLGPSFADSSGLVMAIEYNTATEKVRGAVDNLVKQRGTWLSGAKVPTALTYADRAERVIFFPAPKVVVIVPPHLREQAQKQGVVGVPPAKGPEAMVAFTVNPAKALRRFGLELPASLQSAKLRVTPLPSGEALIELEAQDESAASAKQNAATLTQQINGLIELVSGVSNLLGRFGFGGVSAGVDLPRVTLEADGKLIKGRQVLTAAQIGFILGEVERQLSRARARQLGPRERGNSGLQQPRSLPPPLPTRGK